MKNFSIFKKDNKGNEKLPTHTISMKVNDGYVEVGACWTKQGNSGSYLSCKLSDAWVDAKDNTKSRKSYVIVDEQELKAVIDDIPTKILDDDGRDLTPDDTNPF